ncbi:hypothetical protein CKALI_11395 [Corynebacterium kalinowskii]|uniref:Uncharacterized protein n=1 Tax=Corynebacterium kalinowskii TaxID=2675216 RepID=A0A6B8VG60_9CORY|nr:hypothetical protein CKALI_11395 [Corynebacterium kalinowskii]
MGKHKRGRRLTVCLRCQNMKVHEARGLCKCCYNHLAEHRCRGGESLDDYPLLGAVGRWGGAHTGTPVGDADKLRRKADPGHIPMREARKELCHAG